MSNRFHNKFHRHNHHTTPTDRSGHYPDSAYDPIASPEAPFRGEFYVDGNITTLSSISAAGDLCALNANFSNSLIVKGIPIDSTIIQATYTTVKSNSAHWESAYGATTNLQTLTGNWESAYDATTNLQTLTSNWENTATVVQTTSSVWLQDLNSVLNQGNNTTNSLTANIITAAKFYGDASGLTGTTTGPDWALRALSANWQNTYTTVKSNSAHWESAYDATTNLQTLTGNWESTKDNVNLNSPDWNSAATTIQIKEPIWDNTSDIVQNSSSKWNSVFTNVNSNSASWSSQVSPNNFYAMQPGEISYNSDEYIAIVINGVTRYIKLYDIAVPSNNNSFNLTINTQITSL